MRKTTRDEPSEALKGRILLEIARENVRHAVLGTPELPREEAWLLEPGATFVTVRHRGNLRGCLGSLEARQPLLEDLRHNARAAATRDPRFPPLEPEELDDVRVEVSLLSPLERVPAASEVEALAAIARDRVGWVLEVGRQKGTFLPQVWDALPEPRDFFRQLKLKAGLSADFWSRDVKLWRYDVHKWVEGETAT